jgi:hypothetical protein
MPTGLSSLPPAHDAKAFILAIATTPVQIVNQAGKRETVTALEARIMELASGTCRRRIFCQDFISLVRQALTTDPVVFNATLDEAVLDRLSIYRMT